MYTAQVKEFNLAMGAPVAKELTEDELLLSFRLIGEEYKEFCLEAAKVKTGKPHANLFKEAGDLIYVLVRLAVCMGVDMDRVFNRIHQSNMSKLDPRTGKPVLREDGKVTKGPAYKPPFLDDLVPQYTNVVELPRDQKQGDLFAKAVP